VAEGLWRMSYCALFVDYENIAISLAQTRQTVVPPSQIARVLRENAEKYGALKLARAFADWDRFSGAARAFAAEQIEPRFVLQGKNSADMELSLQVQEVLSEENDPIDTYILAAGDRDYMAIVNRLKREGKYVVVWGISSRASTVLKAAADEFVPIEELLKADNHTVLPAEESLDEFSPSQGRGADAVSYTTPVLATLILKADMILHTRAWNWVAFKTLCEELADDTTFGQTPAERAWWVNLAVSEGILKTEKRPHARNPEAEVTACYLNREHPLAAAGLELVPRIIQVLREQLASKPWVAYGLLDRTLAADPNITHSAVDRRFWINTLIHMGAIITEKKENPNYPDRPVTGCRLNFEHPLVRRFRYGPSNPEEWIDYHLILCVEHFTVNKDVPWMSMGQLRRVLEERYGGDRMRAAIERAIQSGIIIVNHYPNRSCPERPTAGCHLNPEHPAVISFRSTMGLLIRVLAEQLRYRPWAPLANLEKAMSFHREFGETEEERRAWLALLMEQDIILVDKRPDPQDPEYPTIACRLSFADRVVQSALRVHGYAQTEELAAESPAAADEFPENHLSECEEQNVKEV
jgi:uncharacterized LabA/DUF88 family protein